MTNMLYFPETLTHREVPGFAKSLWRQAPSAGTWEIDLTKVKTLDSAFLALLVALLRFAKQKGLGLQLHGLPNNAKALLSVYGLLTLFEKHLA